MADNTVGLLFQISADPSQAVGALEHFRRHVSAQTDSLRSEFRMVAKDLAAWGENFRSQLSLGEGALTSFRQGAAIAFDELAQGMTMNIAVALAYSKSVGEAAARALRATAMAITAESILQALRSLGLGFYLLALGDLTGSANAFRSAALWGAIGGAAGAMAGALPSPAGLEARSVASGTSARGEQREAAAGAPAPPVAARPGGGVLNVLVLGEPQAAQWLAKVINTGVERYDVRLVASHTKRPATAVR